MHSLWFLVITACPRAIVSALTNSLLSKPSGNNQRLSVRSVVVTSSLHSQAVTSKNVNTASYVLDKRRTEVFEYDPDSTCDLYQVGRSESEKIDLRVGLTKKGFHLPNISRFACRIEVNSEHPHQARVFAAGFDDNGNIFLGENAMKFRLYGKPLDGFTTCGIYVLHPCQKRWGMVSVNGEVFDVTEDIIGNQELKESQVSNVLQDKSLIDLAGTTLVWRTRDGLKNTPTIGQLMDAVKGAKANCPVTHYLLGTHMIKYCHKTPETSNVYNNCGHVQCEHGWGRAINEGWTCPVCRTVGPVTKLVLGSEPALYMDDKDPDHAFLPCGHMASAATVKHWARVKKYPKHPHIDVSSCCPFCMGALYATKPYVKLFYAGARLE